MNRKQAFKIAIVILLIPYILGAIYYNKLPDTLPTHFDVSGTPDDFSSKAYALFGLPTIMLGVTILTYVFTNLDPKRKNQNEKIMSITYIFLALLTVVISVITVFYGLGKEINVTTIISVLISLLILLIGNYLPKTKRNYTVGIKVPWTLESDYVWNKTHQLAGKLWVIAGIIGIITSFINPNIMFVAIMIVTIIPIIYSYQIYKNQQKNRH